MPFTFSHPAAIIPLLKTRKDVFSTMGLIVGSLSPDFEYFLRMKVKSHHSHTYLGLFYFDLPASIIICVVFQLIIKKILVSNLPDYFRKRIKLNMEVIDFKYLINNRLKIIASILIGALTHIVWDDFTHSKALFVELIPVLKLNWFGVPIYRWCQHLSSVLGITICFYYFHKSYKKESLVLPSNTNIVSYWFGIIVISVIVLCVWYFAQDPYWYVGDIVAAFIAAVFIALVIMSLIKINKINKTKHLIS